MIDRSSREEFIDLAIKKQLEIAGLPVTVLKEKPKSWFREYTITSAQHNAWKKWFIAEVKQRFKMARAAAEREFSYFDLDYGLKQ